MPRLLLVGILVSSLAWAGATSPELPDYAGARPLCAEHVMGNGMEIHWQSYATADPPPKVVAFYEAALKRKGKADSSGGVEWRGASDPDAIVTVFATDKAGKYPSCAERPGPSDKTVLLFSKATRFGKP